MIKKSLSLFVKIKEETAYITNFSICETKILIRTTVNDR